MSSLSLLELPRDGVPAADIRLHNVARKFRVVMEQLDSSQILTSWRLGCICRSSTRISLRLATRQSVSSTHGSTARQLIAEPGPFTPQRPKSRLLA